MQCCAKELSEYLREKVILQRWWEVERGRTPEIESQREKSGWKSEFVSNFANIKFSTCFRYRAVLSKLLFDYKVTIHVFRKDWYFLLPSILTTSQVYFVILGFSIRFGPNSYCFPLERPTAPCSVSLWQNNGHLMFYALCKSLKRFAQTLCNMFCV